MNTAASVLFLLTTAGVVICEEPFFLPIVGGDVSPVSDFPFLVALVDDMGDRWGIRCGGSIINENYILTAAHCAGAGTYVVAGAYDLSNKRSGQSVLIDRFIGHSGYDETTMLNDIAVVKLRNPLKLKSNEVEKAVLNTNGNCPSTGDTCTVTGWGDTSFEGSTSDVRLKCSIRVYDRPTCQRSYMFSITNSHICAGTEQGGKDSCQGDSGGPFICSCGNKQVVAGIVSCGIGCGNADVPGVYTNVESYISWITGKAGTVSTRSATDGGSGLRGWLFLPMLGLLATVII